MARTLVIGHRGASGYLPEHTLPGYLVAIEQGADFIEPDLVMTRDGVLIARHENEISGTTDVAARPEFAHRRRSQWIDGTRIEGWFTEDFTFEEIRGLRARERLPQIRPQNTRFDGQFHVPSFTEILQLLAGVNRARHARGEAPIGVYPETKHPTHFARCGLPLEAALLAALRADADRAPVFIQSFEAQNLIALRELTDYPLVRLVDRLPAEESVADIARYAQVLGANKLAVMPVAASGALAATTPLLEAAHHAGLAVHCWTFRAENEFLPPGLRRGAQPQAHGDLAAELAAYLAAGIDGFFTDQPDLGRAAVAAAARR